MYIEIDISHTVSKGVQESTNVLINPKEFNYFIIYCVSSQKFTAYLTLFKKTFACKRSRKKKEIDFSST